MALAEQSTDTIALALDSDDAGTDPAAHQLATVSLVAGTSGGGHDERVIVESRTIRLDADGNGTVTVVPNDTITPPGTVYRCAVAGKVRHVAIRSDGPSAVSWADPTIQVVEEVHPEWQPIAGPPGPPGDPGPVGETGATGPEGPTGATGPQGPQGNPGTSTIIVGSVEDASDLPDASSVEVGHSYIVQSDGDLYVSTGEQWLNVGQIVGPEGPLGPTGATGPQGPAGVDGATGATGAQGPQGDAGPQGDTGPAGPGVPDGGSQWQVLTKASSTDGDTAWLAPGVRDGTRTMLGNALPSSTQYGDNSVAIGQNARSNNNNDVAIGNGASASGANYGAVAVGSGANASQRQGVAIGFNATAGVMSNSMQGNATGTLANAIGFNAVASGTASQAFGISANATHAGSVALGSADTVGNGLPADRATTTAVNQIMLGTAKHTVTTPGTVDFRRFSPEMIDALRTALGLS